MTTAALAPVADDERVAHVDVLRALALFGVLMVNALTEFRVSIFDQFLGETKGSALDRAIDRSFHVAIESKAFALFSLLFGVGLAIQLDRARARGRGYGRHTARRLAVLLAIGVVHLVLIWNGDILTEYALAGILMAWLIGRPPALLLVAAALLFVVFVAPVPFPEPFASLDAMRAHLAEANRAYANGSFVEVLAFRVREIPRMAALDLRVLPRTCGLFALGACAWKAGVVARPWEHRRLLLTTAIAGAAVGGAASLVRAGVLGGTQELPAAWGAIVDGFGPIALALGYAAIVVLVCEWRLGRRMLLPFAPLGRMALTSYLTQSIVLGFVFYGYGLGRFGRMPVAEAALLGLALYAVQVAASIAWLRHFRFGPVEWLWRCATYGAWQPMRRAAPRRTRPASEP